MSKLYVDEIASKTGGTDALTIDSTGNVLQPNKPAWRVSLASAQTESTMDSDVTIAFNKSDSENCFLQGRVALSSGIITVPVAGLYQVNLVVRIDSIGNSYVVARIKRNNNSNGSSETYMISGSPAANYDNLTGSDIFKCDANDTLRATIYSDNDSNWNISSSTVFSGHLIG